MQAANKLKVLCSGTGYFSQFHYDAWKRLESVDLVGVCNRSIDKAKAFSQAYDIPNVFDDLAQAIQSCQPDIVDVITPPETHLEAVKLCAAAKVNVICQKPFGDNLEQARTMVKLASDAGIKLVVHENFRFMPWYREIKTLLSGGVLGDVLNATFKLRPGDGQGADAYLARQPYFQDMPKFLVHETAIHLVDTFRYLFGEPISVYANLRKCNPVIKGEDAGIMLFEFANNIHAIFDGNRLLDHASSNTRRTMGEFEVAGTKGSLTLDGEGCLWFRHFGSQDAVHIEYDWRDENFGGDCVYNTIAHIESALRGAQVLENQGIEYLQNIKIEQAIYQSAAEGKKILF